MPTTFAGTTLRSVQVNTFTPQMLFANGEVGAWYDPSDMTTMFQDEAATAPVTAVEQSVGRILDKSKFSFPTTELVTNGDFSSGTTGWTSYNSATFTASNGEATLTNTIANFGGFQRTISTTSGRLYRATFVARRASTSIIGNITLQANSSSNGVGYINGAGTSSTTNETLSFYFVASGATTYITGVISNINGLSGVYDNISVVEVAGNHATTPAAATTSRPVLSARYNLLTKTEQFDDAVWVKTSGGGTDPTITSNSTIAPDGTLTADTYSQGATPNLSRIYQVSTVSANSTFTQTYRVKKNVGTWIRLVLTDTGNANGVHAWFNLDTGVKGSAGAFGTGATFVSSSMSADSNGFYLLTLTGAVGNYTSINSAWLQISDADNSSVRLANSSCYIWGADLRVTNDGVGLPVYQRVNTSTDYDTVGFPMYLRFDGSNDYMLTGTITPNTDKAQVFAGMRKLSDAAAALLLEFSTSVASSNGSLNMGAPGSVTPSYSFVSRGTTRVTLETANSYPSPITNVVTGIGDIANDVNTIRVNGVQAASSSSDQGTGNYLAYPLYIGMRAGTSVPFNGRLYSLIVRFAANLDAGQIEQTETWVNGKTKAY